MYNIPSTTPQNPTSEGSKLFLLVLVCIAWILPGLVGHEPWKPDDAQAFGVVYHMLKSGDWIAPTLAGEPFLDNPPFFYWVAALFAKLFSPLFPLHDGARFASGFFMAITLSLTALTARKLYGVGIGRLSVLMLIGSVGLLVHAHLLVIDLALMTATALVMAGLTLFTISTRPYMYGLLTGTGIGMAFLSKGLSEAILLACIPVCLPLAGSTWRSRQYLLHALIALAASLPWLLLWPILLNSHAPVLFETWWDSQISQILAGFDLNSIKGNIKYFAQTLPWFAWPAWPIVLWGLWRNRSRNLSKLNIQLPLIAIIILTAALPLVPNDRDLFALPMLVPLSILAAGSIQLLKRGAAHALDWFGTMTFGLIAFVLWLGWIAMVFGHPQQFGQHLLKLQPDYTPTFEVFPFIVAAILTILWMVMVFHSLKTTRRAIVNWAIGITLMWGLLGTLWLPWVDTGRSYRALFTSLKNAVPERYNCIAGRFVGEPQRAMIDYYAGITITRESMLVSRQCDYLLVQEDVQNKNAEVMPNRLKLWEGHRPGDKKENYVLYRIAPTLPSDYP